ncbi:MAG: hypothetical protein J6S73_08025 [Lentisphaeria bacterium]|nr:hypothetical protein [Lentisphaeria bacterium]
MSDENFMPYMSPVEDFSPKELYNPMGAAVWSIFLTPIFGEWCILQNSKVLDDEEGVARSKGWIAGMIAAVILFSLLPPFPGDKLLSIVLYLVWFFGSCRSHERWLLTAAPDYIRKSWLKPVFCGCGCLIFISLLFGLLVGLFAVVAG